MRQPVRAGADLPADTLANDDCDILHVVDTTLLVLVAISAAAAVLLALCGLLIARWFLRRFSAMAGGSWGVFGSNPTARLVGLGLAVWLFPDAVTGSFNVATGIVQTIVSKLPSAVWAQIGDALTKNPSPSSDARVQIVMRSLTQIGDVFSASLHSATALPVATIFLALAAWAVSGQLLSAGGGSEGIQWGAMIRAVSLKTWKDLALFAVLFLGVYLSIAAITSIPSLQKSEIPVDADKSKLTQQLQASRLSKADFDRVFDDTAVPDPLQPIKKILGLPSGGQSDSSVTPPSTAEPAGQGTPSPPSALVARLPAGGEQNQKLAVVVQERQAKDIRFRAALAAARTSVGDLDELHKNLHTHFSQMRTQVFNEEDSLQTKVADLFDAGTVGRMGARDRSRYMRALDSEFQRQIYGLEGSLRGCYSYVSAMDTYFAGVATRATQEIEYTVSTPLPNPNTPASDGYFRFSSLDMPPAMSGCPATGPAEFVAPAAPSGVDDWGVFRFFAGWLIRAESLPLAIIAGMLGAGLLGASASTFVRHSGQRVEGDPLVDDLAGIVIRGFSAAIVIFLAVEGGLNLFSSGSGEPNPYVLLCTCLIGSVFSEDVWTKAQEWLQKPPAAQQQAPGEPGKAGGSKEAESKSPGEKSPNQTGKTT